MVWVGRNVPWEDRGKVTRTLLHDPLVQPPAKHRQHHLVWKGLDAGPHLVDPLERHGGVQGTERHASRGGLHIENDGARVKVIASTVGMTVPPISSETPQTMASPRSGEPMP